MNASEVFHSPNESVNPSLAELPLSTRLRRATGKPWFSPPSKRVDRWIGVAMIAVIGCIVVGAFAALVKNVDSAGSLRWNQSLVALSLQMCLLWGVAPAVMPTQSKQRLNQLYLPIRFKEIVRRWIGQMRVAIVASALFCPAMGLACLACGAEPQVVFAQLFWHWTILFCVVRVAEYFVSDRVRYWWPTTAVWWTLCVLTLLAIHAFSALDPKPLAVLAFPFWYCLQVPNAFSHFGNPTVSFVACLTIFVGVWWASNKRNLSVTDGALQFISRPLRFRRSRLRRICRFWRNLPDRDDIRIENLTFPETQTQNQPERTNDRSVADQIRDGIRIPATTVLMDTKTLRKAIRYRNWFGLSFLVISIAMEILFFLAGSSSPRNLGVALLIWQLPTFWGMARMSVLAESLLITRYNASKLAMRGIIGDSLGFVLLCFLVGLVVGSITGDTVGMMIHLAGFLALSVFLRWASLSLLWFRSHAVDAALIGYVFMGSFFLSAINNLPAESMLTVIALSMITSYRIGWHRIARVVRWLMTKIGRATRFKKHSNLPVTSHS